MAVQYLRQCRASVPSDYDVCLCNKNPTEETALWCTDHGGRLTCRQGVADYDEPPLPRRTQGKEGNLASFYDHWGAGTTTWLPNWTVTMYPRVTTWPKWSGHFEDSAIRYVRRPVLSNASQS